MNRQISPTSIAAPAARYAHAVLSEQPTRWLHTSGVVPTAPDGSTPNDLGQQAAVVWQNIAAMLDEAGMSVPQTATPQEALRAFLAAEPAAEEAEADLRSMVTVVQRSAYHPQPPDTSAGDRAWTYYDGVSLALREQRSIPQRARMLFDPRTLRQRGWNPPEHATSEHATSEDATSDSASTSADDAGVPSMDSP